MTHFTLIHGAWHGAWCWQALQAELTARGHESVAITLSGLGERAEELSPDIELQTWVEDAVTALTQADRRETVLVGHSFAGNVITGVAADPRVRDRLAGLVYLDAMVPISGAPPCDTVAPAIWAERRKLAVEIAGTRCFQSPPGSFFALKKPEQIAFVEARMTPHPLRTYETAIQFDGPPGAGLPCRYIMVTDPVYDALADHRDRARALGWPFSEIACGHDAMIEAPGALADLLIG